MIALNTLLLIVILPAIDAWFEGCDQRFQLAPNADVQLQSPFYPGRKYPSGSSCRYTLTAPLGYSLNVVCTIAIDTQQGSACSTELFYISTEGLPSLVGSEFFCGTGTLTRESLFNKMMIAYTSSSTNSGGSFNCRVKTQPQSCDCGWEKWQKIVGGNEAGINEYTSIVGLQDKSTRIVFCSGVIINYRYIMTAAHCFDYNPSPGNLQALVGGHNYRIEFDTPYSELYDIERIVRHEKYIQRTYDNDIAILRTTVNMEWNRGVGPVCLPFNYWYYDFNKLQVDIAGWGTTSFGGPSSTTLKRATLDVIANKECNVQYVNVNKICVHTPGKDTCQLDSGGPLYLRGMQRMYTIGIVSYGGACGTGNPSVNTRVSAYLDWIQNNTRDAAYCVK
ncbi:venom serine protease-like [Toxorhynchites rutilus septentrionalis]|uniref:venom serine protease-like n=1 Tax=Toxorhynchites rutilus septentrionalis TaxID=329112 RepID=UPI0024788E7D|nr:venom serine protease-like [Toxorhynchites rutilus septentrionalis]